MRPRRMLRLDPGRRLDVEHIDRRLPRLRIQKSLESARRRLPNTTSAPGRRRIARAWGVVYINDDGTVDEEPSPITPPPNS